MIEDLITARLKTALSADVAGRVYHAVVPQNALLPAAVYRLVGGTTLKTLDKSSQPSMRVDRYQIDLYAVDSATARRMARAACAFEGYATDSDANTHMRWVWQDDDSDDYEPPRQMDEKGVRIATVGLTIWHD